MNTKIIVGVASLATVATSVAVTYILYKKNIIKIKKGKKSDNSEEFDAIIDTSNFNECNVDDVDTYVDNNIDE